MATIINCGGSGGGTVTSCPFPVGYGGFFQTDPNSIYAGTTWEQKKDVFILAAGDTYPAGSTGGEAKHKLTEAELPALSGEAGKYLRYKDNQITSGILKYTTSGKTKFPSEASENCVDSTVKIAFGGSQPHNNMPPYFAMPFWIRTA